MPTSKWTMSLQPAGGRLGGRRGEGSALHPSMLEAGARPGRHVKHGVRTRSHTAHSTQHTARHTAQHGVGPSLGPPTPALVRVPAHQQGGRSTGAGPRTGRAGAGPLQHLGVSRSLSPTHRADVATAGMGRGTPGRCAIRQQPRRAGCVRGVRGVGGARPSHRLQAGSAMVHPAGRAVGRTRCDSRTGQPVVTSVHATRMHACNTAHRRTAS